MHHHLRLLLLFCVLWASAAPGRSRTADGKPVALLIAGKPSHKAGEHEFNAGVLLFAKCLGQGATDLVVRTYLNAGWPTAAELAEADTVLVYCDGGEGHLLLTGDRLADMERQVKRGVGFVALHYGVEFPTATGGPQALAWMGGFFEIDWSVNPHWVANYPALPVHPVTSGVRPFGGLDEWYFHLRFAEGGGRLTPILQAVPPATTMARPDGAHSGNPTVRAEVAAGKPQTTAWAFERADGGRGFGFTGGHFHRDWLQDDRRRLVLNAILWTAKVPVPASGVASALTEAEMGENLDPKPLPKAPPVKRTSP